MLEVDERDAPRSLGSSMRHAWTVVVASASRIAWLLLPRASRRGGSA